MMIYFDLHLFQLVGTFGSKVDEGIVALKAFDPKTRQLKHKIVLDYGNVSLNQQTKLDYAIYFQEMLDQ